ncbi:laccase 2 precursor [Coprinellus micaceus]|uniref:Laccase 2 n=1 Tax=Coprinellus micaceus TaxID=71717 RepID=A0A4Y7TRT2_COPMI|nr:laccase 2 precursor [Coprinellus micaceus]
MLEFATLAQLVGLALGAVGPSGTLTIANAVIAPDGFQRSAVLAGDSPTTLSFPGPVIQGTKGTSFSLNVVDNLADTTMERLTSIHWHGFFQSGSAWADGPTGVTQCPIVPGNSFLYEFSAAEQAGTFWYHSHFSSQYCDGLRGAMVVYDPNDPHLDLYDVDNEATVITLADWYQIPAPSQGVVPTPDSTLINGKGRFLGGPLSPLAVVMVNQNSRYRFRLVSISCDSSFVFSIDGHTMNIIESDGISTEQLTVDSLEIFAGQRYSFVLEANQAVDNYWIRANPSAGTAGFDGGLNSAILRYVGAADQDPTTLQQPNNNPLLETNLHPLTDPAAPGTPEPGSADVNINIAVAFDFNTLQFQVNGAPFIEPSVPVLLQILSGATAAQDMLPPGSVYELPLNSVVELTLPGGSTASPHPIHLHGHAFSVVRSAGNDSYNFVNPVRRDVVNTGNLATDLVTIRFRTDNSGPWIMHCHIDWHLIRGLSVVFAEGIPETASSDPPMSWDDLCPAFEDFENTER